MQILIAPNAFKNSLNAMATAMAIREGFEQSRLDCVCECFPVGDGGDGTATLLIQHAQGKEIAYKTVDALGRALDGSFGALTDNTTAVIEMAASSGLRQLAPSEYNPLKASSYGTGKLIIAALDHGAKKIIMGIGGSATVDGATGILRALGVRFLDRQGQEITELPSRLSELSSVDITAIDNRIEETEFILLCDVENKLLGAQGSAAVFAPQKGASPQDVIHLDNGLRQFRDVTFKQTGYDMAEVLHGGAAGGTAAGLAAFCKARLVNGIEYFLDITDFESAFTRSDLVITGEGSLDEQTLEGKAPFGVAKRAKEKNLPVIGLAGKVPSTTSADMDHYFDALLAIGHQPSDLATAMKHTASDLTRTAKALGNLLAKKR
ncbi:MAG: glycerate kinase [Flavitalea sp.]